MTNFAGHKLFVEPDQRIKSDAAAEVLEFYALDSIPNWWV